MEAVFRLNPHDEAANFAFLYRHTRSERAKVKSVLLLLEWSVRRWSEESEEASFDVYFRSNPIN